MGEEDSRCLSLQLMCHFCDKFEQPYVEKIIVSEMMSLSEDMVLNVRRSTAIYLVEICKHVSHEVFESRMLPTYYKLSKDQVWGVRKATVEILPQMSEICSPEIRGTQMVEVYKQFARDNSKWVKWAAFQYLGPFIATLKDQEIDQSLITHYLGMGDPRNGQNSDNTFHCAFNFPAVLYTLGPDRWEELKGLFFILVRDSQWKVR